MRFEACREREASGADPSPDRARRRGPLGRPPSNSVHGQYAEGLPPGILGVEVDGQPIDAVTIPVTNNPAEISGR